MAWLSRHAARSLTREPVRRWLYGLLLAAVPLVVRYTDLDPSDVELWVSVAAAILATERLRKLVTPVGDPRDQEGRELVPRL